MIKSAITQIKAPLVNGATGLPNFSTYDPRYAALSVSRRLLTSPLTAIFQTGLTRINNVLDAPEAMIQKQLGIYISKFLSTFSLEEK